MEMSSRLTPIAFFVLSMMALAFWHSAKRGKRLLITTYQINIPMLRNNQYYLQMMITCVRMQPKFYLAFYETMQNIVCIFNFSKVNEHLVGGYQNGPAPCRVCS